MHQDKDLRRQGDLGAVGAFYGYSWPLGRYWNIEAQIGAAVGYTKFKAYECGHCGKKLKDESKVLLMPQAALSVVYNIPGRPRKTKEEPQIIIEEPIAEPQIELPVRPAPEPVFEEPVVVEQKSEPVIAKTKVRDTLYVHFPWSKSVLSEDFRENRETLQRIIDVTRESASNGNMTIKKIQIVGLASVEGNTAYNERLAHNRALALKKYVQQHVDLPDEKFEIVGGGEAWEWFRKQLVENVDKRPDLKRAIEIIDTAPNVNNRKWRLHVMNHGQTWEYIRRNILKNQRNSGYIIVYYEDDEKQ
jgi:outer membrane protein OmpA-like peptidoglycan-associated protein